MINDGTITTVYAVLKESLHRYQEAEWHKIEAETDLKKLERDVLLSDKIDGRNAQIRDAQMRKVLADQYDTLYKLEREAQAAKDDLELARIDVEHARLQMRYEELVASIGLGVKEK